MQQIEQNSLDKMLCDIAIHLNPEYIKWDYHDKIDTKTLNKSKLNEYFLLLSTIDYFYKKVLKYEIYFSEFYPISDKIKNIEALEYHIHSYLECIDILRNKIRAFLGVLKNDLKKIAENKQEIDEALKKFISNVEKTFNEVTQHRNPHHHKGPRFLNSDLVDAEMCAVMLKDDFPLKHLVNIPIVEKKETEHFEKAKNDYVALSKKNNEQITGLINTVFDKNGDFIHEVLNIKSLKELMSN